MTDDKKGMRLLYRLIVILLIEIGKVHETLGSAVACPETEGSEAKVLGNIDRLIDKGITGLYPLKALLMASNNWYTFTIVREGLFRDVLLEGIEKGALAPDNQEGWSWMKFASLSNDPADFMTDTDCYYDLVMSATENGNPDAHEIMDMIWEPENCQEED